jgi:hypothetical protein
MGVRIYTPTLGRFLTVDPVPGGSASPYAYTFDPVNAYDLDGRWWQYKRKHFYHSVGHWISNRVWKPATHSRYWNHGVIGHSGCFVLCYSVSIQGGHLSVGGGGFGLSERGLYLGYNSRRASRGWSTSWAVGAGYGVGAYHSRGGWKGNKGHEVGVFAGGGWYGGHWRSWTF